MLLKNTETSVSALISYYLSSLQLVVLVKRHVNSSQKTTMRKTTASRRVCLPVLSRNLYILK